MLFRGFLPTVNKASNRITQALHHSKLPLLTAIAVGVGAAGKAAHYTYQNRSRLFSKPSRQVVPIVSTPSRGVVPIPSGPAGVLA